MLFRNKFFLCCVVVICQYSLAARELYTHQQANDLLSQAKLQQQLNQLKTPKSENSQLNSINLWLADSTMESLIKDKLLYEATLVIREKPITAAYRQAMENLLDYQTEAYLPLEDAGRIMQVPAFPVAASARATLIHWQIDAHYQQASNQLATDPEFFLQQLSTLSKQPIAIKAYSKVIKQSHPIQLAQLVEKVKLQQQPLPLQTLSDLARQTGDQELYLQLVEQYQDSKTLQSMVIKNITALPESLSDLQKIEILTAATDNSDLGNAAVLALSEFVDSHSQIRELLNNKLSDPETGGAAAKALSESKDLLTVSMLDDNLDSDNAIIIRRSLLALYLNNSYQSQIILKSFQQTTTDEQLKREVSQWLK